MRNRKRMQRLLAAGLSAALALSLSACGGSETAAQDNNTASAPSGESTDTAQPADYGNILIAYFTADENTEPDAVSSASVTEIGGEEVGRVRAVADMIAEETGGTLFSIRTSVEYPEDGGALIDYAAGEQDANARPELTTHIENLDDYDTVFIGYPNWWGDMPMVLYSFFDEYDFAGKTIIPFNVHNGSRFSRTIETIQELEPEATVVTDGFTVNESDVADAQEDVASWLQGLGF
nr:flavodoxin [uncultured Agathobaculum sp.]